jgi:hypothetical protein
VGGPRNASVGPPLHFPAHVETLLAVGTGHIPVHPSPVFPYRKCLSGEYSAHKFLARVLGPLAELSTRATLVADTAGSPPCQRTDHLAISSE